MGTKDITEKLLEDYNDIFADIVNVLLFNGDKRIAPDNLVNANVHSMYKDEKGKVHEQERDVAKYWMDKGMEIALCGLENQTRSEKKMPLRIYGYEGASYRTQLDKKDIAPVVTLVLYFGEEHWTAPTHLKELISIPAGLDEYVNDIAINVFEISWLTDEQLSRFESDFKVVANFFVNKRKNKDYIPDDKTTVKHMDEVLKLLSAMSGDNRYETILSDEKEMNNMCEVAQRLEDRGFKSGLEQGLEQGKEEALRQSILKLNKKGYSSADIADMLELSLEEVEKIIDIKNVET